MRTAHRTSARGFSLVEALVASLLIASAVAGLAHLVAIAAEQSLASRHAVSALTGAHAKLEQLRRAAWTYDANGGRVSSAVLTPSPPQSLREDSAGYVDFVDGFGQVVAPASEESPHFARRWSIAPFETWDADTLILQVCVFTVRGPARYELTPAACVTGVRTRKP